MLGQKNGINNLNQGPNAGGSSKNKGDKGEDADKPKRKNLLFTS